MNVSRTSSSGVMHDRLLSYNSADVVNKNSQWSVQEKDALISIVSNRLEVIKQLHENKNENHQDMAQLDLELELDWSDIAKDIGIESSKGSTRKRNLMQLTSQSENDNSDNSSYKTRRNTN